MNDIKVGDKLEIHCYKHNGKIDRISGEALVLDVAEDYLVCANNKVKITESDGKTHRTKETAILFFYKNEWFNILAQLKKFGLFYYCNIATPYIIDDNVIKYIDYDLDLRVFPNGSFKVLDRNEYKYQAKNNNGAKLINGKMFLTDRFSPNLIVCTLTREIVLKKGKVLYSNISDYESYFNGKIIEIEIDNTYALLNELGEKFLSDYSISKIVKDEDEKYLYELVENDDFKQTLSQFIKKYMK